MARRCDICGKGPQVGYNVSHAHNRTKKVSLPNLHRVKAVHRGKTQTITVCTRCLRSGLVKKPAVTSRSPAPPPS